MVFETAGDGGLPPAPWLLVNGRFREASVLACMGSALSLLSKDCYSLTMQRQSTASVRGRMMHAILTEIQDRLAKIAAFLQSQIPSDEPLAIAHTNWNFPSITRSELIEEAQSLIDLIGDRGGDDLGRAEDRLSDYVRRLDFLLAQTLPQIWGSAATAVPAYLITLEGLRKALASVLNPDPQRESMATLRRLQTQLRGMESRLRDLEPRTNSLASMVERIEHAYEAADQLPTDLETLEESRKNIATLEKESVKDREHLQTILKTANELDKQLHISADEAKSVLANCESAYSAATSVGLAAAFSERSDALSRSMWIWVGGLVIALGIGGFLGITRLHDLTELIQQPSASSSAITVNLVLSLLSVGAPVWFAWLATKQTGQRFRLAEDYAFKASVSRAYEGFRREAARFDKDMEARLLASALNRLDELPLRLVESGSHGSPLHELISSDVVKQAMNGVPGFAEQVKELATKALNVASGPLRTAARKAAAKAPLEPDATE